MTYTEWKALPKTDWKTEPIPCTCEVMVNGIVEFCGATTTHVYPARGCGWQSLCAYHAKKHTEAFDVYEVIKSGEKFE